MAIQQLKAWHDNAMEVSGKWHIECGDYAISHQATMIVGNFHAAVKALLGEYEKNFDEENVDDRIERQHLEQLAIDRTARVKFAAANLVKPWDEAQDAFEKLMPLDYQLLDTMVRLRKLVQDCGIPPETTNAMGPEIQVFLGRVLATRERLIQLGLIKTDEQILRDAGVLS